MLNYAKFWARQILRSDQQAQEVHGWLGGLAAIFLDEGMQQLVS
jgi:hypothetical protein